MMIDPKDLRPFKASELQVGGIFYLKTRDKFEQCCITKDEIDGINVVDLRRETQRYSKEGRLYVRISKPWSSFV